MENVIQSDKLPALFDGGSSTLFVTRLTQNLGSRMWQTEVLQM